MGRDKSQLLYQGQNLAQRTAHLLKTVVERALEVGPGVSGLVAVHEALPGRGPLAAIVEGRRALERDGHRGPVLVVACDMPMLTRELLHFLATFATTGSAVPVVDGFAQPLCAKWGVADLEQASDLLARGERSVEFLTRAVDVRLIDEFEWSAYATSANFRDVDTPEDARRLGIEI
jgi:molybdopterin-guanine dinucleotide biosynthesis protein A